MTDKQPNHNKPEQEIPPVGRVQFGDLRRTEPLSRSFGYDRGQPIDRYYIARFLNKYSEDITGHVVEIGDDRYTRRFGKGVTRSDILDQSHPDSSPTIVADLAKADHVADNSFDCIIVAQTLQFIYNIHAAVHTLYRILKPSGVLLASLPSLSPICRYDMDRWGDYWRFTSAAARNLFSESFGSANIKVEAHGNVLVAMGFLQGMAADDLTTDELNYKDPDYEALITVRAVKSK